MKALIPFAALLLALPLAAAQDPHAKPGPEMDVLKGLEGTWTITMSMQGMEAKGTTTWKMELDGRCLCGAMECEMFGSKFTGKSQDSYDPVKKKYVSTWADSMTSGIMMMEGTFDKEKKAMTLEGTGPGQDGKPTKYKSTSTMTDADTVNFAMYMGDGKEPGFTIVYKRKK